MSIHSVFATRICPRGFDANQSSQGSTKATDATALPVDRGRHYGGHVHNLPLHDAIGQCIRALIEASMVDAELPRAPSTRSLSACSPWHAIDLSFPISKTSYTPWCCATSQASPPRRPLLGRCGLPSPNNRHLGSATHRYLTAERPSCSAPRASRHPRSAHGSHH